MRSTLALLLLLFGAVIGVCAAVDCKLYELPTGDACTLKIKWKVHNNAQATAACLEYFPTTFVKGTMLAGADAGSIECTVEPAYQCVERDTFLMFDKCYKFPKTSDNKHYEEGTIDDYTGANKKCKGGKLSVFYSYAHAKFLGMKARALGIDKLWIGITKDGYSIEEPTKLIHSELWKLVGGDYWDMETGKPDPVLKLMSDPKAAEAKYYFMRTRNDEFNRRYQGSFERATAKIKATFACEFEAKFTERQEWYCDKMKTLGMNAVFDEATTLNGQKARCLYVTANKYTWDGTHADMMANVKGCLERPSNLHSAAMDDGTGTPARYAALNAITGGTLRLAGNMFERIAMKDDPFLTDLWFWLGPRKGIEKYRYWRDELDANYIQTKCTGSVQGSKRLYLFQKWRYYDHHGKIQLAAASRINWDDNYPLNECSDFPGVSNTLGLKNGKLIDMPPEVRAPAVCSLAFFQECENNHNPCGPKVECKNEKKFNPKNQGFFSCHCPGPTKEQQLEFNKDSRTLTKSGPDEKPKTWLQQGPYITKEDPTTGKISCEWNVNELNDHCAWVRFYDGSKEYSGTILKVEKNNKWDVWKTGADFEYSDRFKIGDHDDRLDQVVVRDGCKVSIRSFDYWHEWRHSSPPNFELITNAEFGTHEVPNWYRHTLPYKGWAASNVQCLCT